MAGPCIGSFRSSSGPCAGYAPAVARCLQKRLEANSPFDRLISVYVVGTVWSYEGQAPWSETRELAPDRFRAVSAGRRSSRR
jgi:hypothetical protein